MPGQKKEKSSRRKARSTAVWDPRQCEKYLWDWYMERIPPNAIGADMTQHAPHNSHSPLFWYEDQEFTCAGCGRHHTWTAQQQQWWYEVAKGSIYTRAKRCQTCQKAVEDRTSKAQRSYLG